MIVGAKLLLLQAAIVTIVPISDPRVDGQRKVTKSCEQAIVGCGEFQPPSNEGSKLFRCKFNRHKCGMTCVFKCNKGPDGKRMKISNRVFIVQPASTIYDFRRHSRDHYQCVDNVWTRRDTPQGYCLAHVSVKEVRQNLHHTAEMNDLANKLINSSFVYLAMASFYERADVALPGFSKLMTGLWEKDMKHARDLMTYVNTRGGYINLVSIPRPSSHEDMLMTVGGRSGQTGLALALSETHNLNGHAIKVQRLATEDPNASDPHLKHFLEDGLLNYKIETIKKLADLQTQLKAFTTEEDYRIGEYSIDLELRG